jgi:uncharacterized protein (TIGR03435 family)
MNHKIVSRIGWIAVLGTIAAFAQTPAAAPAFEVASIKPAVPPNPADVMAGKLHVGMKTDGARVDIGFLSLADLIRLAYNIKPYQLTGPDWMNGPRFDILAKMPEGSSQDQVPAMLQALLAERFKLAVHRDSKEHSVYALVLAKGGLKLKESAPDADAKPAEAAAAPGENPAPQFQISGNTITVRGTGSGSIGGGLGATTKISMGGGSVHMEATGVTMAKFADLLSGLVDRPVVDETDLKGKYDMALDLSMEDLRNTARAAGFGMMMGGGRGGGRGPGAGPAEAASDPSGSAIWTTIQSFGLKLDSRKEPLETIVVDHLEKAPTEN